METRTLKPVDTLSDGLWKIERYNEEPLLAVIPDALESEAKEYEELGMDALAQQSTLLFNRATGKIPGKRLTLQELSVWEWRYPSVFWTGNSLDGHRSRPISLTGQREFPFRSLSWPVPADVRKIIRDADDVFPLIEIWTPEIDLTPRVGPSPILVGWLDGTAYLLARWAEALEPWEELVRRASTRQAKRMMRFRRRIFNARDDDVPNDFFVVVFVIVVAAISSLVSPLLVPITILVGWKISLANMRLQLRKHAASMGWVLRE